MIFSTLGNLGRYFAKHTTVEDAVCTSHKGSHVDPSKDGLVVKEVEGKAGSK